jgi:hypothetical protein
MPELPEDWHPPQRDLAAKVWAEHPETERLEELWRERGEDGERLWKQELKYEPDGWTELWLLPVDEYDLSRTSERVGHWHTEGQEVGPVKDAQALVDEHHVDE